MISSVGYRVQDGGRGEVQDAWVRIGRIAANGVQRRGVVRVTNQVWKYGAMYVCGRYVCRSCMTRILI